MNFQAVKKGDPIAPSAGEWNAMLGAAVQHLQGNGRATKGKPAVARDSTTIAIRNSSGEQIERYRAVALGSPFVTPQQSLPADDPAVDEFKNRPVITVFKPNGATTFFAIAQQDIPPNEVGTAVAVGMTPVWINLKDTKDRYFGPSTTTSSFTLESSTRGYGQIVWAYGGSGGAINTGEQWVLGLIGPNPPEAIYVKCVDDLNHDWPYVSVKRRTMNAPGGITEGDAFNVGVITHVSTGDEFLVVPGKIPLYDVSPYFVKYVQVGLPTQRSKGMVLQIMDDLVSPHSIDFDWLKAH